MSGRVHETVPKKTVPGKKEAAAPSLKAQPKNPVEPQRLEARPRLAVAIASEAILFRDVLSCLLKRDPALKIVGQAHNERDLTRLLRRERPQALLFDYEALGPNGESVISRLRRAAPTTRILVMAARSSNERVGRVLRAGASGLVDKHLSFETLMRAIHAVARGEVWADRRTTAQAIEQLTSRRPGPEDQLTRREIEIAEAVGRGLRNKEIASQLRISQKTVKSHLNNIFRKLGLDGRIALALLAQERGAQPRG
jgi:two-component system, NarL family, nitrate/nitrite response regulator NarL